MMPKGHKSKHGYATVDSDEGLGFREIADIMSASGDKMNHATARNILLRGLHKLAKPLCELHGVKGEELELEAMKTASDPRFQDAILSILTERYGSSKIVR
jgi:hypothetical protein